MAISTIGSTLHISAGVPATEDATGCAALTWTKVGSIEDVGDRAQAWGKDTVSNLETGQTQEIKTFRDPVSFAVNIAENDSDAGQTLLKTAFEASTTSYRFKLTHASGKIQYLQGQVFELSEGALDGNHGKIMTNISIDGWANGSKYITVAA